MNIPKRMQALNILNHLDAQLENIHLLEVFLVLVENGAHSFAQFVLHKELGLVIDLLDLVSLLQGSHSPVF